MAVPYKHTVVPFIDTEEKSVSLKRPFNTHTFNRSRTLVLTISVTRYIAALPGIESH